MPRNFPVRRWQRHTRESAADDRERQRLGHVTMLSLAAHLFLLLVGHGGPPLLGARGLELATSVDGNGNCLRRIQVKHVAAVLFLCFSKDCLLSTFVKRSAGLSSVGT